MGEPRLVSVDTDPDVRYDIVAGDHVIGRAADADLIVPDASVSRRHARLRRRGQELDVADLGSSNGTFVNGRRIGGRPTGMRAGDIVRVGSVALRLQFDADDTTSPIAPQSVRFDVGHQSGDQIWNVGGNVTVAGEDEPWDELFQGTPVGRLLMVAGLLAVVVGFVLWMAFIFTGFSPPAGGDLFNWNPFTNARRVFGVPQPILGFALFGCGGLVAALGSGLSRAQRRRRGDVVRPIRRSRR